MWLYYRSVDRELSRNFIGDPSRRQVGRPWHRGLKHYILYCLENDNFKTAWIRPCVHWRDCACLVHKICGYCYCKKGVYVKVIGATAKRYFRVRQNGPAWKCIYRKSKPTKHTRNHENLTKRTSELQERAIIPNKRLQWHLFFRRMYERL